MTDEQKLIYSMLTDYEKTAYSLEQRAARIKEFVTIGKGYLINDNITYDMANCACANLDHTNSTPSICWLNAMKPNWKD